MSARSSRLRRGRRLHDDVDRHRRRCAARSALQAPVVVPAGGERDVDRGAGLEPDRRRRPAAPAARGASSGRSGRLGDQGGDVSMGRRPGDHEACAPLRAGAGSAMTQTIELGVLIAGPTASGKSALALALAERLGGVIINTNSMQVYRDLDHHGAARRDGGSAAPHLLYGHVDAPKTIRSGASSKMPRRADGGAAPGAAADLRRRHRALFQGADQGLAAIPPVPAEVRPACAHGSRRRRRRAPRGARRARSATAARLKPADRRALLARSKCLRRPAADRRLARDGLPPLLDPAASREVFLGRSGARLPRASTRASTRCSAPVRWRRSRRCAARQLDPLLPAMSAHGVPWLIRFSKARFARGSPRRQARHPALCQAPVHLVSPPARRLASRCPRGGIRGVDGQTRPLRRTPSPCRERGNGAGDQHPPPGGT